MTKLKKGLVFKQVSPEHVDILIADTDKKVGHIFTPAGSTENVINAIQVCGFNEAFDYWGCGIFGESKENIKTHSDDKIARMKKHGIDLPKTYKDYNLVMKKDIQLVFEDYETKRFSSLSDRCAGCYNEPCTCETSDEGSRYKIKTSNELKAKGLLELKDDKEVD